MSIRQELREGIQLLSLRGLRKSAIWCAELLQNYAASDAPAALPALLLSDAFLVAKSFFDQQEFDRCAHCLSSDRQLGSELEFFLWAYSTYLSGERRREEAHGEGQADAVNDTLPVLIDSLTAFKHRDSFCDWLLGVCLQANGGRSDEAKACFVASLRVFPLHWSCWLDLFPLLPGAGKELSQLLPDSTPRRLFAVHMAIESQLGEGEGGDEVAVLVNQNTAAFPQSPFQLGQRALFHYGLTDYETAHVWFDRVMDLDPFRLTGMDCFSNLLFVKEARAELSHLAHQVFKIDRYRAESCVVVGNYYALKRQHDRAVVYFQRALKQDRDFHSALILLGHEFVELKNFPAALDTYRKAVESTPSDYRAWYGLGQAYELNRMFYYALHYYQKAKALRPYDPRIWVALGGNYENLGLLKQAIKCFERAEENDDKEGIAFIRLAKLYEKSHDGELAARYFEKHLVKRQQEGLVLLGVGRNREGGGGGGGEEEGLCSPPKQEDQDALRFLALYFRDGNRVELAFTFAENLQRIAGGAQDREIDALLRELQARRNSREAATRDAKRTGAEALHRPLF